MDVSELPKGLGLMRPLAYLCPEDRLVYTALVGVCYRPIFTGIAWSQATRDFAHQLSPDENAVPWIRNRFSAWRRCGRRA